MNYTSICTIEPLIPNTLVNAADLELLSAFGLSWECTQDRYYFYSSDFSEFGHLEIDDPRELARCLADEYPENGTRPGWVGTLISWLDEHPDADDLEFEPGEIGIGLSDILIGILDKPANQALDEPLIEFVVDGAYTASRIAPGSHGGWSVRVTQDGVSYLTTHRHGEYLQHLKRLSGVLAVAQRNSGHRTPLMQEVNQLLKVFGVPTP